MVVFEIYINGKRIALAGQEDLGVLSTIVSAVGKLGPSTKLRRRNEGYEIDFRVGGLTSRKRHADEHVDWVRRELKIGDEISVRVTEGKRVNRPRRRTPSNKVQTISERERFAFAKAEYYRLRRKYEGKGRT